ncbi:MAG TPA: type II secretion system minor pseudopilin GspK [Nitrospiria bacterium]
MKEIRSIRLLEDRSGVILLITLVILVVLTALVVEFDYGTRIHLATAANFRDDVKAGYLAKAGISAGRALLQYDKQQPRLYDGLDELWAQPIPPYPVGEGTVSFRIQDESGKLNINLLGSPDPGVPGKWMPIWDRLVDKLDIQDKNIVAALMDWIDQDSNQTFNGAEDSFYLGLDPPYSPRNGPMASIGEIRLVKGVTFEVFEKLTKGCGGGPCFTVAPTDGVNLNTVSFEVCLALHDQLTDSACNALISQRESQPLDSLGSNLYPVEWTPTGSFAIAHDLRKDKISTVKSNHFLILATSEMGETRKTIKALVHRQGPTKVVPISWQVDLNF